MVAIRAFEPRQRPQALRVVVIATGMDHGLFKRLFARMAEGRVADVVTQAQRFGQVLVEPQLARQHAADLRDLETMRQPGAVMVAIGRDEHLRLGTQAAEGDRMNDPVAVSLEGATPRVPR